MNRSILLLTALLASPLAVVLGADTEVAVQVTPPTKPLPLPGEVFLLDGHTAFLIPAAQVAPGQPTPWVWYAPTLPNLPAKSEAWMFQRFTDAGIAIAGIDVGESYGSPDGRALYSKLYQEMTQRRGYSRKPVMLGRSRGGLMTLAWAVENADKVGGFAGIYPVCNLVSYPGVANAAGAYGCTAEELQSELARHNPVDRVSALALAGVPMFAIHGDVDTVVPLEANSGLLRERYVALGGNMQLVIPKGQGHNMWSGFFESEDLVAFVKSHAFPSELPPLRLSSPLDYQVIQRNSRQQGIVPIAGALPMRHCSAPVLKPA